MKITTEYVKKIELSAEDEKSFRSTYELMHAICAHYTLNCVKCPLASSGYHPCAKQSLESAMEKLGVRGN